jgi:predicted dehydrogenase
LHKEWVNKALLAGNHVYAEKSIASNLMDAEEMVSNAEAMNLALMEGFMFQYHQQHQVVKDLINNGDIGAIRYFTSSFGFPPLGDDNFRYDEVIGGGALLDAAAYTVRAVHFLLGADFEVNGASVYYDPDLNTSIYGSAFLSDSKGIGAAISFGFDNFYQCSYEIWGEKGKIIADRAFTPRFNYSPTISIMKPEGTNTIAVDPQNHFIKAFEEFYQTIKNPLKREKHYSEILLQSKTLEQIKRLSKSK